MDSDEKEFSSLEIFLSKSEICFMLNEIRSKSETVLFARARSVLMYSDSLIAKSSDFLNLITKSLTYFVATNATIVIAKIKIAPRIMVRLVTANTALSPPFFWMSIPRIVKIIVQVDPMNRVNLGENLSIDSPIKIK